MTRDSSLRCAVRARDPKTGDELSFDCSFNTLEISFGPDEDLTIVRRRFGEYYPALQEALLRRGHSLSGMGINPRWRENRPEPIGNGRDQLWRHSRHGRNPHNCGMYGVTLRATADLVMIK